MPQSAEAVLAALHDRITQLEQLCNEIELSLRAADMSRLGVAIAHSRRLTHEFENAMGEAKPLRTEDFDQAIFARLQRIYSVRAEQMHRLAAKRDEIGGRLRTISKWKEYARSVAGRDALKRKPRIIEDIR